MRSHLWISLLAPLLISALATPRARADARVGDYTLVGPYVKDNLAIFVVLGADKLKEGEFLTLDEAMRAGKVKVRETGDVNHLVVENTGKKSVYIQGGEIVKGGRQDRVLEHDTVLPPRSGKITVAAYCVESGRWSGRHGESAAHFNGSSAMIATKEGKLAARAEKNQSKVWSTVEKTQDALGGKVGHSVKSAASPTSLQLTLEDKQVQATAAAYVYTLAPLLQAHGDAVGLAFAVNGKVNSVDVFATHAVFAKTWPKLLGAAAVEALALRNDAPVPTVSGDAFAALMTDADSGAETREEVTPRVTSSKKETAKSVVFTTEDKGRRNAQIRKAYIAK